MAALATAGLASKNVLAIGCGERSTENETITDRSDGGEFCPPGSAAYCPDWVIVTIDYGCEVSPNKIEKCSEFSLCVDDGEVQIFYSCILIEGIYACIEQSRTVLNYKCKTYSTIEPECG